MRTVVIYPGRFHPFHRGHKASYDHLVRQYGADNVYIVSSEKQAPLTSPFSFDDKTVMMTKLGVPPGRIVKVKNPYQAHEITKEISDPDNTVLIFAVSEKDMAPVSAENPDGPRFNFVKKDGTPGYMQPLPDSAKKLKPMTQNAYVAVTPTVNFQVQGVDANSAKQIRSAYIKGNDNDKNQIIADLYGEPDQQIRDMFDQRLGQTEQIQKIIKESRSLNTQQRQKLIGLLERVKKMEALVNSPGYQDGVYDNHHGVYSEENPDYIEEKWSEKYKRSINCARPKGFSQRAHCAGRKKK